MFTKAWKDLYPGMVEYRNNSELVDVDVKTLTAKLQFEEVKAELNSRLVRTASIIFLPLLALPIGVSSRRTSKGMRMLVGILFIVAYFQILQFGRDALGVALLPMVAGIWLMGRRARRR